MNRDEVKAKICVMVARQQGERPYPVAVAPAKDLQEAFGISSLDVVSLQIEIEEEFKLKFGTGPADRGQIDAAWDAAKSIDDLVELVLSFRC